MYLTLYFSPMKTPLRLLATLSLLASSFLFAQPASAVANPYSNGNGNVPCITDGQETGYFTIVNNVVTGQTSCDGSVTIPDGVTAIDSYVFPWRGSITSLTLNNGLRSIGDGAFNSTQLSSLTIPSSVISIGDFVFFGALAANSYQYCGTALTSADLGSAGLESKSNSCAPAIGTLYNSNTRSGDVACTTGYFTIVNNVVTKYQGCVGAVNIPSGVTTIGNSAFEFAIGVTSVVIPNSVTTIGVSAFERTSGMTSLTLGNSIASIPFRAFYKAEGLTSLTIPNSVTSIGDEAFYESINLTSLTLGSSVVAIGEFAFNTNRLTSLVIPNSVTTIGGGAFGSLTSLSSLTLGSSVTTIGAYAFSHFAPSRSLASLTIPRSVASIGDGAFAGAKSFSTYEYCGRSLSPANLISAGLSSELTNTCIPTTTTPNAPTSIVATSTGSTTASVAFTAPTDDGGSPITGYTVVSNPGRRTASVSQAGSGTISITGLTPGTAYTFRVVAINAIGESNPSSPSNAVPEVSSSSSSSSSNSSSSNTATITAGSVTNSQVATFSSGVTEAVIPSSTALPAVKLSFTGSAPTSVTVVPTANPATPSRTPFMTTSSPKIVDIQITTGAFSGPVTVCLDGAATDSIFHFTGGAWVELPERSYDNGQVCGVTNSFSPFVAAPAAPIASLSTGFAATFSTVSSYDSRITVQITNFDPEFTYTVTSSVGSASITPKGLITVTNIGIDRSTVVTVTTSRAGYESATSGTTGRSQVAPMIPTNKPSVTITDTLITCTIGSYSATPTSSAFSLFVDGKHVSTIFSALGEYLPDWIIPWATSSSITRTATLTSATWTMSDAYKGKSITCATLAYSKNAIGFTASQVMVAR